MREIPPVAVRNVDQYLEHLGTMEGSPCPVPALADGKKYKKPWSVMVGKSSWTH